MAKAKTKILDVNGTQIEFPPFTGDPNGIPFAVESFVWSEDALSVALDIRDDRPVILSGHCGIGKTSLPKQICARIGWSFVNPPMDENTTTTELVGKDRVRNGNMEWINGFLIDALENGKVVCFDEIDMVNPAVFSAFNALYDSKSAPGEQRSYVLKEDGHRRIVAHPNFRMIATCNTFGPMSRFAHLYPGAKQVNMAQQDRYSKIYHFKPMEPEVEIEAIVGRFELSDEDRRARLRAVVQNLVEVANLAREAFENEEIDFYLSTRRLLAWTEELRTIKANLEGYQRNYKSAFKKYKLGKAAIILAAKNTLLTFCKSPDSVVLLDQLLDRTIKED